MKAILLYWLSDALGVFFLNPSMYSCCEAANTAANTRSSSHSDRPTQ